MKIRDIVLSQYDPSIALINGPALLLNRNTTLQVIRGVRLPKCLDVLVRNRKFGKAAMQTYQDLGENPNDWLIETIKPLEMKGNFCVKRLDLKAGRTTPTLHNILTACNNS